MTFPLLVALRTGASALDHPVIEEIRPKSRNPGSFRPVSPEIEKTPSGLPDGKRVPARSFRLRPGRPGLELPRCRRCRARLIRAGLIRPDPNRTDPSHPEPTPKLIRRYLLTYVADCAKILTYDYYN